MDDALKKRIQTYASNKLSAYQMESMFERLDKDVSNDLREKYIGRFAKNKQNLMQYLSDTESSTQLWNSFNFQAKVYGIDDLAHAFPLSDRLFMFWDCSMNNLPLYRLGREYVFSLTSDQFLANIMRFPADAYVFDAAIERSLVLTHEDFHYNKQKIIMIG